MTRNPVNHDANRAERSLAQRNALDRALRSIAVSSSSTPTASIAFVARPSWSR